MSNLVQKMLNGLSKTRKQFQAGLDSILSRFVSIDEDLFDELEEMLILSDVGAATSADIMDGLRSRVKADRVTNVSEINRLLIEEITKILDSGKMDVLYPSPSAILVIGVNGAGKTTSIGKLTNLFMSQGKKVVVAAADTFRAAAIDQLAVWCERCGAPMIRHQENSDPGAVVYDSVAAAKSRRADILICDTAGRLQNKKNLMEELKKLFRVLETRFPEARREVLLVLDATTGQNGLNQARIFKEAANVNGVILTKLDGTAKGGIVIAIQNELKIPVKYICAGEAIDDIQPFNARAFAEAMLGEAQ
ncbi:MAG: signal recognition particle-docking protein FtsY [Clostridiales bacterium]|jgi:fused signal recognition particle receptor|nr:signal recognition particle-docking protein FtsY [Clostridiales bacterium]